MKIAEFQKKHYTAQAYQEEFEETTEDFTNSINTFQEKFEDNPEDFTILPHERLNLDKEDQLLEAVCQSFGADMKLIRELHDVEYSYVGKKARSGIIKTMDQIIEAYLKNPT